MFNGKAILVTGGTGSFGKRYLKTLLERYQPKRLIVNSREELKQFEMQQEFDHCLGYFKGDVRDRDRLARALRFSLSKVPALTAPRVIPHVLFGHCRCRDDDPVCPVRRDGTVPVRMMGG